MQRSTPHVAHEQPLGRVSMRWPFDWPDMAGCFHQTAWSNSAETGPDALRVRESEQRYTWCATDMYSSLATERWAACAASERPGRGDLQFFMRLQSLNSFSRLPCCASIPSLFWPWPLVRGRLHGNAVARTQKDEQRRRRAHMYWSRGRRCSIPAPRVTCSRRKVSRFRHALGISGVASRPQRLTHARMRVSSRSTSIPQIVRLPPCSRLTQ